MSAPNNSFKPAVGSFPLLGAAKRMPISVLAPSLIAAAILLLMYTVYPAFPTSSGRTLAGWAWTACNSQNGFLHGRFIPFAFCVMLWIAWQRTKDQKINPSYWGLAALGLGLLLYLLAMRTIQPRLALIGVPFSIIGLAHFAFGFQITKAIIFPAFFFWFTIPVPGLEAALTGNLQTLITRSCYHLGTFVGMDLTSSGSTISVKGSDLDIAEGCSGIRSLMALTMIAAVYANYTQKSLWKKAVLFASSFPLAIIGNFGRIFTILILSQMGFGDFGKKTWHDWAGLLLFFPIALSGLYLFDYLLNFKERMAKKVKRSIKQTRKVVKGSTSS